MTAEPEGLPVAHRMHTHETDCVGGSSKRSWNMALKDNTHFHKLSEAPWKQCLCRSPGSLEAVPLSSSPPSPAVFLQDRPSPPGPQQEAASACA